MNTVPKSSHTFVVTCRGVMVEPGRLLLAYGRNLKYGRIWWTGGIGLKNVYTYSNSAQVLKEKHWHFRGICWNSKFIVDLGLGILHVVNISDSISYQLHTGTLVHWLAMIWWFHPHNSISTTEWISWTKFCPGSFYFDPKDIWAVPDLV